MHLSISASAFSFAEAVMYIFILLLFGMTVAQAQPDSVWSRIFDNGQSETCQFGFETSDGNFVFGGRTGASSGIIYGSGWVVKTDSTGDTIWSRTLTPGPFTYIFSGCEAENGDYVLAGWVNGYPHGAGSNDFWLARISADGDSLWSRFYGGEWGEQCYAMVPTFDGGFALAGETTTYRPGVISFWLVKVDADGDSLWSQVYGITPGFDARLKNIQQTSDSGYVLVGHRPSTNTWSEDYWIVKTDADGDSVWSRTYGGSGTDICYSIVQTPDGGYVLLGSTESFGDGGPDSSDVWVLRIDENGDSLTSRVFGGEGRDEGRCIRRTSAGDYIIGGGASPPDLWYTDLMVMKVDSDLDSVWGIEWGTPQDWESVKDVTEASDGGIILFGQRRLSGTIDWDFWIIRLEPDTATQSAQFLTSPALQVLWLHPNYPNPFNATTSISYDLPRASQVLLNVFDITGRVVATLVQEMQEAGQHHINFNAHDLPSGIYVYRLSAGAASQSRKLVVLK